MIVEDRKECRNLPMTESSTQRPILLSMASFRIKPISARLGTVRTNPVKAIFHGPKQSESGPTKVPSTVRVVMHRKIKPAPSEFHRNVRLTKRGKVVSKQVAVVVCVKQPKKAALMRGESTRIAILGNLHMNQDCDLFTSRDFLSSGDVSVGESLCISFCSSPAAWLAESTSVVEVSSDITHPLSGSSTAVLGLYLSSANHFLAVFFSIITPRG